MRSTTGHGSQIAERPAVGNVSKNLRNQNNLDSPTKSKLSYVNKELLSDLEEIYKSHILRLVYTDLEY